jgi:hypothetical protein
MIKRALCKTLIVLINFIQVMSFIFLVQNYIPFSCMRCFFAILKCFGNFMYIKIYYQWQ